MTCDAPKLDKFTILRALAGEIAAGERLSDRIMTADYLEALAADRGGLPRDISHMMGLWRPNAPAATVADAARKLLGVLRGEHSLTPADPRQPVRNTRRHAAEPEISS